MWRVFKELEIDLPYDPAIALLRIYPKGQMQLNTGTPDPDVYSSNGHDSQTVEGASVSNERWMDKEDVVYVYNGILLSY